MDERWYTMDRPKSKYRKMSMLDRAAQFAPFAALTGHKEAVIEQVESRRKKEFYQMKKSLKSMRKSLN